jgi:uncharacterized phage protein (predicted DNA packaging)
LSLAEIKEFLKIDGIEEDTLINGLLLAAKLYLANAGATINNTELYNLAVKLLVGHWYENRNIIGKADKIAFSLDCIITQLKYADIEYNEAVIKLIQVALTFNADSIQSIKTATDLLIQAGGTAV